MKPQQKFSFVVSAKSGREKILVYLPCALDGSAMTYSFVGVDKPIIYKPEVLEEQRHSLYLQLDIATLDIGELAEDSTNLTFRATGGSQSFESKVPVTFFSCGDPNCEVCVFSSDLASPYQKCIKCKMWFAINALGNCTLQASEKSAVAGQQALMGVGAGVSLLSFSGASSLLIMVNQYQLLQILLLMNFALTQTLEFYFQSYSFASFDFKFLSFLPDPIAFEVEQIDQPQPIEALEGLDAPIGSYLVNEYRFFWVLAHALATTVLLAPLLQAHRCFVWCPRCQKALRAVSRFLSYPCLPTILIEAFFFHLLYALAEIVYHDPAGNSKLSFVVAVCAFCLCGLFFLVLLLKVVAKRRRPEALEGALFGVFFSPLKGSLLARLEPLFFLVRRGCLALLIVFFRHRDDDDKLDFLIILQAFVLAFAFVVRPFTSHKANLINMLNEALLLFAFVFLQFTPTPFSDKDSSTLLTALLVHGYTVTFIIIIAGLIGIGFKIARCLKKLLSKKKKVEPENKCEVTDEKPLPTPNSAKAFLKPDEPSRDADHDIFDGA
jgi:hypothetical protein